MPKGHVHYNVTSAFLIAFIHIYAIKQYAIEMKVHIHLHLKGNESM